MDKKEIAINAIREHLHLVNKLSEELIPKISELSELVIEAIRQGNKVVLFGNGGSAADAQHIAAELSGKFVKERKGLAGLALTTNTSVLTSIGNDYGFSKIFERQVEALCNSGDVLIGISTSGHSENIVNGIAKGKEMGCKTVGLLGRDGGKLKEICDETIIINSNTTARIQEMHILIGHIICEQIDAQF